MDGMVDAGFFSQNFMPHGHCYLWKPEILWTHVVSDALIAASYYSIPLALVTFVRKRGDVAFSWIFILFGLFIFSCGTNHLIDIWTTWSAQYGIEAVGKAFTAGVSVLTAVMLWPLLPKALALPSTSQLAEANASLLREVERREELETALRRANEDLDARVRERTAELERTNSDLEGFTFIASHDLQEPLRNLISYTTLLETDLGRELPKDAAEDLGFVKSAARRMQRLIDDLLAYSRAGRHAMNLQPVDLDECVDEALENLESRLEKRSVNVVRDEMPTLNADRTLLVQLFQNLIGNAIKFNDKDDVEIRITAVDSADGWVIGVRDNGIGLKPEYAEQIFFPFKRLHGMAEYEGSGIGLSICRKSAQLHGGEIWVDSTPGQGAHFQFTLPNAILREN